MPITKAVAVRPYKVTDTATQEVRLVTATSQAQARNYVTRSKYLVEAASANDALELVAKGVKPETATEDKAE